MKILAGHIEEAYRLADTAEARARVKSFDSAIWQMIVVSRKAWMEKVKARSKKGGK